MDDIPKDRQTLLFSATIPPNVDKLAKKILHEPKRVTIGKPLSAAKTVDQRLIWLKEEDKNNALRRLLSQEKGPTIVFTRSKDKATRVFRSLHSAGFYDVTYIHSDRRQSDREQALAEFKEGKYRILIATDVAGRGIHVDAVAHVINFDLPFEPEDYVHRIGRTGRAEASGMATSFATPGDRRTLAAIEKLINKEIPVIGGRRDEGGSDRGGDRDRGDRGGDRDRGGRGGDRDRGGRGGDRPQQQSRPPQALGTPGGAPRPVGTPRPVSAAAPAPTGDFYELAGGDADVAVADEDASSAEGSAPSLNPDGTPRKRRRRRGGRGRRGKGGGTPAPTT
jgi:ATP-dependent RNA helicase RhlE